MVPCTPRNTCLALATLFAASTPAAIAEEFRIVGRPLEAQSAGGALERRSDRAEKPIGPEASSSGSYGGSFFYDISTVVAEDGVDFLDIEQEVSINDNGTVACIALVPEVGNPGVNVEHIIVGNGSPGSLLDVTSGVSSLYDPQFSPNVQINNLGKILARRIQSLPLGVITSELELWDSVTPNSPVTLVYAEPLLGEFDGLYPDFGLNNANGIVFAAIDNGGNELATLTSAGGFRVSLSSELPEPLMADDNNFVMRLGSAATGSIQVLPPAFFPFKTIATTAMGFGSFGKRPGISDDGTIVAFYADLDPAVAATFGTNGGPGIFVSVEESPGVLVISRVAGVPTVEDPYNPGNGDGICDNGESCVPSAEVGWGDGAAGVQFASFSADMRVGVTNAVDGSFTVSFVATPTGPSYTNPVTGQPFTFSAAEGLWTVRVDALRPLSSQSPGGTGPIAYLRTSPIPVVQVGDVVDGRTISALGFYDPIALVAKDGQGAARIQRRGDHQIACWASTDQGDIALRAVKIDSDTDGLLDHWETAGLDIDGDGNPELDLPAMGALPNRRDLFVEVDWLAPAGTKTYEPSLAALEAVVEAFGAAPSDPVVGGGIECHIDAGSALSGAGQLNFSSGPWAGGSVVTNPSGGGPVNPIFMGEAASLPAGYATMSSLKTAFFGSPAEKMARELVFHYALFGEAVSGPSTSFGLAGLAEVWFDPLTGHSVPGNDVVVALQGLRTLTPSPCQGCAGGTDQLPSGFLESQTLLHELGHNLGLRHRGSSVEALSPPPGAPNFNALQYDPTYRSVMNYGFLPGLGTDVVSSTSSTTQISTSPAAPFDGFNGTADLSGERFVVTRGLGVGQGANITANTSTSVGVSPSWAVVPDATSRCSVVIQSFAQTGDAVFDDWSNIKLDFQSYTDGLFVSNVGRFGRYVVPPVTLQELLVSDLLATLGGADSLAPAVAVVTPADSGNVATPDSLVVVAVATDDVGISEVTVSFDANGDAAVSASEVLVAVATDSVTFTATIPQVVGGAGLRDLVVRATDVADRVSVDSVLVMVQGTTSTPTLAGAGAFDFIGGQPNPARGASEIRFSLPHAGRVRLAIYDVLGRRARTLLDGPVEAGARSVNWDGKNNFGVDAPAGVYFARLEWEGGVVSRKLTLLR